jgi:hypothetical protein
VSTTGTHTFRFGNVNLTNGLFRVDAISLKKVTPSGGTINHWNLNDSGNGNPYPDQIYFYLDYYGGGKIGFNNAIGYTFLSQGLVGQNFVNEDKYRVSFKISNYSGNGSLACRLYNDQGHGFWKGGFQGDGNYEIFKSIGDNVTYNPSEEEEFAFYVESGGTFTGNIDNIMLEKVGGGETVTFNEESKGWVSFKSFIPEYGISVVNQYYTMDKGKLYHHHHLDTDRNTFYNIFEESSVTPILNLQPDVVKNFNTLNYEGSQSKIDEFTTITHGGADYTDQEYYNLYSKDGWYVHDIHTDKQVGQVNEFIEKEGKWFNHIKSEFGIIDPRAFNFQGIGIARATRVVGPSAKIIGCMDKEALNYDPLANTRCEGCCVDAIPGCMDPLALNYNPNANVHCLDDNGGDDKGTVGRYGGDVPGGGVGGGTDKPKGPCCIPVIAGCMDKENPNYNPLANTSDPAACSRYGCTDPTALNYDPNATIDDGSCQIIIYGCMEPSNANYNPLANVDDGSCYTHGCTNPNATNYNPVANYDDGSCLYPGVPGCTDQSATNYDPLATIDDGSCLLDSDGVYGCTDQSATNYDPLATIDDGSCLYSDGVYVCDDNRIVMTDSSGSNIIMGVGQNASTVNDLNGWFNQSPAHRAYTFVDYAFEYVNYATIPPTACNTGTSNNSWYSIDYIGVTIPVNTNGHTSAFHSFSTYADFLAFTGPIVGATVTSYDDVASALYVIYGYEAFVTCGFTACICDNARLPRQLHIR